MTEVDWGVPVAIYLFLAGLGAGGFVSTAVAWMHGYREENSTVSVIAVMIPVFLIVGVSMLILDLGRKEAFWKLLLNFHVVSPMSMGVWILIVFSLLCAVWAVFLLPRRVRAHIPGVGRFRPRDAIRQKRIGFWGSAVAVLVAVYTGVLLSSTAVPLWNWALAVLFLFSSLSTGFALGLLGAPAEPQEARSGRPSLSDFLKRRYRVFLVLQLIAAGLFLMVLLLSQPKEVSLKLLWGWMGIIWWAGGIGVGMVLPFAVSFRSTESGTLVRLVVFLELAGAFSMRLSLLMAGQA